MDNKTRKFTDADKVMAQKAIIDDLRKKLDGLRKALEPFAKIANAVEEEPWNYWDHGGLPPDSVHINVHMGLLRDARHAFNPDTPKCETCEDMGVLYDQYGAGAAPIPCPDCKE